MDEEHALSMEISKGQRASAIINDPMVIDAFLDIKVAIKLNWEQSGDQSPEFRERCWLLMDTVNKFESIFRDAVDIGVNADRVREELEEKKTFKEKVFGR